MPSWLDPSWPACIIVNGVVLALSFALMFSVMASAFSGAGNNAVNANGQPRRGGIFRGVLSFGIPLLIAGAIQIGLLVFDVWSVYHMISHDGIQHHDWKWYLLATVYAICGLACLRFPSVREG